MLAQQAYIVGNQPMFSGNDTCRKREAKLAHLLSPDFIMKPEMILALQN
jgi:hypothetical protein